ncbi:Formyl-CoA:oxalate CoA-transferase [compost metagenome]
MLHQPALANDERFNTNVKRVENRAALRDLIVQAFASLSLGAVTERLEQAQIANAQVNDMQGVWDHPQLQARERWTQVDTPAGPIPGLLPPVTSNAYAPRMDPVPGLGEHTDQVLAGLGWSAERIGQLRARGVV